MIAKKVPNPKKSRNKAERVHGLCDYITAPELSNGLEKCIATGAVNFLTDTHEGHKSEMIALAQESVRSRDPVDHWVLSWRYNEYPTPAQAREAVEIFIKQSGLEGHQYIWGMHDDTKNRHVHIAVNRVNPDTLKVTEVNKGFDREAGQQAVALIEHVQGWQKEANARYHIDQNGSLYMDSETGRPAKLIQSEERKPSTHAADMEAQTGEKSAQRIGIETAAPIIKQAVNWKELHARLAEFGMKYERKGSGAVVHIGDVLVKASDISRAASLMALQKRLGAYQPPQEIKKNDYFDTSRNFTNSNAQKPHAFAPGKDPGHSLRNLSQCTLAHNQKGRQNNRSRVLQLDARPDRSGAAGLRRGARLGIDTSRDSEQGIRAAANYLADNGGRTKLHVAEPILLNQPGWKEYCALRETQKVMKAHDIIKLQKRHEMERTQLYTKLQTERAAALAGDWKGRGVQRNMIVSLTAIKQAAAKRELQEQHKKERAKLQAQYKALPLYKEWRDQPRIVSHAEQDKSGKLYLEINQTNTLSLILKSLSRTEDWRGHFTYAAEGKDLFRDEGRILAVLDENSDEAIAATLLVAREKFGSTLTLTGSPAFQQRVVEVAVAQGIAVKFADPALEEARVGMITARRSHSGHAVSIAPSTKSAQQEHVQPAESATEIPAVDPVEAILKPKLLSSAEWIAGQHKREVLPHQRGDASIEYTVAYIASDSVVINHGRGVAIYPLPSKIDLIAGQKIYIDKSGEVTTPIRHVEIDGGKGRAD